MARIEITEAELLAALDAAMAVSEDGVTTREIKKATGWGVEKIHGALEHLIVSGAWEPVKVVRTSILTGITRGGVNAYRPVKASD